MSQFVFSIRSAAFCFFLIGHSANAVAQAANDYGMVNPGTSASQVPQTPTINPGANLARQQQLAAANHNKMVGMLCLMEYQKSKKNEWLITAILLFQQADHLYAAANQSEATAQSSNQEQARAAVDASVNKVNFSDPKIREAEATLAKAGIKVDRNGNVTMPNGSVFTGASMSTPSGMAAAGLDPTVLDQAQKLSGTADSSNSGSRAALEAYGGGSHASENSNYSPPASATPNVLKPKLMAGKTVMFDGEPIGVKADNIFEMVHNCYQRKLTGKEFIQEASGSDGPQRTDGFK